MRLIDADKLKKHYSWWKNDKQKLFDTIVDQQETIDAIPVKWIIRWSAEHMNEYGTFTIERLIEDWNAYRESSKKTEK